MADFHIPENQHTVDEMVPGSIIDPVNSNFRWIGGRRYFTHAPYLLPYDESEFTRQDFEHHLLRQALRGNVLAPVDQPRMILDVGMGTGRWALEVTSQFPAASVVGVDLVPSPGIERISQEIVRREWGTPPPALPVNFSFTAGNILGRLPFSDGIFDYVHMRFLSTAVPLGSWRHVMHELMRVTRRGGWIEIVDTSWTPHNGGPATEQVFYWARIAGMVQEINLQLAAWLGSIFLDSGLANVTAPKLQLPMGRGGGRIGSMVAANAVAVAEALQPWVVGYNVATSDEFAGALAAARVEVTEGNICTYPIFVAYGQRI